MIKLLYFIVSKMHFFASMCLKLGKLWWNVLQHFTKLIQIGC